jgi:uncharacterized membrane protein
MVVEVPIVVRALLTAPCRAQWGVGIHLAVPNYMKTTLGRDGRFLTLAAGVGALALVGYLGRRARRSNGARSQDTKRALGGSHGAHLTAAITIAVEPDTVYEFWRDPGRLVRALPPTVIVRAIDDSHWHWTLGQPETPVVASWTAIIINDEPGKKLSWKTTEGATIISAGSVSFQEMVGTVGTEVRVHMQYAPPLGRLGAAVANLFGRGADAVVDECLHDIKCHLEQGDVTRPASHAQASAIDRLD